MTMTLIIKAFSKPNKNILGTFDSLISIIDASL